MMERLQSILTVPVKVQYTKKQSYLKTSQAVQMFEREAVCNPDPKGWEG